LLFLAVGVGAFGSAKILALAVQSGWQSAALLALGVSLYGAAAWFLMSRALRSDLSDMIRKVIHG
jgi:hypothetical protein